MRMTPHFHSHSSIQKINTPLMFDLYVVLQLYVCRVPIDFKFHATVEDITETGDGLIEKDRGIFNKS